MSADEWVALLRGTKLRPLMPVQNTRRMSERDLRAIYAFIKSLGALGTPAPAFVPPGIEPTKPYLLEEIVQPHK